MLYSSFFRIDMDYIALVLLSVITFCVYWIYKTPKGQQSNIPGPSGLPVVGNALEVDLENLHLKLYEWSKVYGDIFQISLFGRKMVVVNSSRILRELFAHEPNATLTSARPETFTGNYVTRNSDVALASIDKEWAKRRKLMHKLLHAYGEGLRHLEEEIGVRLSALKAELDEIDQLVIDPEDMLKDFVISIIEILLVGKCQERYSDFHKYLIELDERINVVANPGVDMMYNKFPFLRFLPLSPTKHFNKCTELRKGLIRFLEQQSDEQNTGVFHSLMEIIDSENSDKDGSWLTEEMVEGLLLNFIGGGFLTTRGMLHSLLQILMSRPDVQVKIQNEVDRVIGHDRQPSLDDRYDMPYSEAVVIETLRYTSHLPLSLIHSALEDITVENDIIPKNTMIVPNLWTMHHNEEEWKDPFKFDPERFLDENGDMLPADHEVRKRFMGFGYGKRSCIGEVFAKSRIFLFLSTIMQRSTIRPATDELPPILDPRVMVAGITLHPKPYKCKFEKRKISQGI